LNSSQVATSGTGSIIIQVTGDGNDIAVAGKPHLELTRYLGRYRSIGRDSKTGRPNEMDLIRPFARAIDLVGREEELDSLREWLQGASPVSVRVLTGVAGLGKTRLALELVEEVEKRGWRAGFLTGRELVRFLEQANSAAWDWNAPVLAVIDNAAASASCLKVWLRQLAGHGVWDDQGAALERPFRLLLLERSATFGVGWWSDVFGGRDEALLECMLDPVHPLPLRTVESASQRRKILSQTLSRLESGSALPDDEDFERRLAELTWSGVPLLLMMAAVTASRVGFGGALALGAGELALNVAKHELARVREVVQGAGVDVHLGPLVDHLVAVVTLRKGLPVGSVRTVVEEEATAVGYVLPMGAAPLCRALATALPEDAGGVAAVGPDIIGEALLLTVWRDSDYALGAVSRAHAIEPARVMEIVIRTCQDYIVYGYRHSLAWLEALFRDRAASQDAIHGLLELTDALPIETVELRELALEVSEAVVRLIRPLARGPLSANRLAVYAESLISLANRLSAIGRLEDALDAAEEAVGLNRGLAVASPGAFLPGLARSLTNQATVLSLMGRQEEALEVAEEAVVLYGGMAEWSEALWRGLAGGVNNLANLMGDLGRRQEALRAAQVAVALVRDVAEDRPAIRPDLAKFLSNLSIRQWAAGCRVEALDSATEAVKVYRCLAAVRPDAYRPDLATSLNSLSNQLAEVGRSEEALEVAEEAVALSRGLEAACPAEFRSALAMFLDNLSIRFWECKRPDAALDAAEEAVALYDGLVDLRPSEFRSDLARALSNLSVRLATVDRGEEALTAAEKAVSLERTLVVERPDASGPGLASALHNLSNRLSDGGRYGEALPALVEAVMIRRELAAELPDAFGPDLAASLHNLSDCLSELDRTAAALDAAEEAVVVLRGPFLALPAAFAADMEVVFANYEKQLTESGREADAELSEPIKAALACKQDS